MTRALDWSTFLAEYHAQRPGITEELLGPTRNAAGIDPYTWLLEGVPDSTMVVDLACGSAPLYSRHIGGWIGLDRSAEELARAQQSGTGSLVRADAIALPIRSHSIPMVVCAMALMLLAPSHRVLAEIHRILVSGGTLHALMPSTRPLTTQDRLRFARLYATLRKRAQLPVTRVRRRPQRALHESGFSLVRTTVDRFAYSITDSAAADLLVDALYLPAVTPMRIAAAKRYVRTWIGTDIGLPLRRIVARSLPEP
ncbi:MAG: class I SAM-dependent methyltransferase [Acidimicrobiia bacterium]